MTMKNARLYSTIGYELQSRIGKQYWNSPPYFQKNQDQQSLILQDNKWTKDHTKSLLTDMIKM